MSDSVEVTSRDFYLMGATVVLLVVTVVVLIVSSFMLTGQAREAATAHAGLCSFRANVQEQEQASVKYLQQHPDGLPALGVTAAQIQQGIDRQQATLESLSALHC